RPSPARSPGGHPARSGTPPTSALRGPPTGAAPGRQRHRGPRPRRCGRRRPRRRPLARAAPRSLRPDRPRAGTGPRRPRAAALPARIRGEDRSPEMLDLAEADAFHTVAGPDQQVAPFGHTDGLALDGGPTRGGDAYPAPDRVAHRPVSLEDARPQSLGRLAQHVAERRKEVGHQGGSRWLRSLEREARCRAAQLGSEVRRTLT